MKDHHLGEGMLDAVCKRAGMTALSARGVRTLVGALAALLLLLGPRMANAGLDVAGPVQRLQIAPDGRLMFVMDTAASQVAPYCKAGWHGLSMYVPKDHPEYPYYYGMLMVAVTKGKSVYVANISVFDGSGPCDITKTGYGLVLLQ